MKKTVLIVDDSMYMRTMIREALSIDFDIVGEAANGETAIDLALELKPDIITLDNILPDMLGVDILKFLKEEEKLESNIIMISAVGQDAIIQDALKLGAFDYIVKPFTSDMLITSINKMK